MASARALRWQHATAVNLSGEIEIVCCSSETNQTRIGQLALTPHRREEHRRRKAGMRDERMCKGVLMCVLLRASKMRPLSRIGQRTLTPTRRLTRTKIHEGRYQGTAVQSLFIS